MATKLTMLANSIRHLHKVLLSMSKTLEEECEEFCYRREELVRLAECLGDPVWDSHSDEWRSLLGDVTKSEVRKNRLQAISRQIVKLAVPGLKELVVTNKVRNDREIRKVEKIGRLATELVELLGEPNSYRSSYLTAFLETEELAFEQRDSDSRYSKSALVQELTLVAKGADEVKRVIKNSHHYHKANSKTATQDKFVDGLCFVWKQWTGTTPGGSKEGGPAARFVMHAINPVQSFAERELGTTLSSTASWPISEAASGALIHRVARSQGL